MPKQRIKVVDFDVCQNAKKLIGYHKTDDSFVSPTHVTTYAERLTKVSLVIVGIFSRIGRFCSLVQKRAIVTFAMSGVIGLSPKVHTM